MRSHWLETGTGTALLREESRQVAGAFENIFGDQFLQIGAWGDPAPVSPVRPYAALRGRGGEAWPRRGFRERPGGPRRGYGLDRCRVPAARARDHGGSPRRAARSRPDSPARRPRGHCRLQCLGMVGRTPLPVAADDFPPVASAWCPSTGCGTGCTSSTTTSSRRASITSRAPVYRLSAVRRGADCAGRRSPRWPGVAALRRRALPALEPTGQLLSARGPQGSFHCHADPPRLSPPRRSWWVASSIPPRGMRRDGRGALHRWRLPRQSGAGRLGRALLRGPGRGQERELCGGALRPRTTAWS